MRSRPYHESDLKLLPTNAKNRVWWRQVLRFSDIWIFFRKSMNFWANFGSKMDFFNFQIQKMARKLIFFKKNVEKSCFYGKLWPIKELEKYRTSRNVSSGVFRFWAVLARFYPIGCSVVFFGLFNRLCLFCFMMMKRSALKRIRGKVRLRFDG